LVIGILENVWMVGFSKKLVKECLLRGE